MKKTMAFLLVSASLFLSSVGINPAHADSSNSTQSTATATNVRKNVIAKGMIYLGTPYEFGSSRSNTTTFDCSDFVRQAYLDGAGIKLPADSRTQGAYIKKIGTYTTSWKNLKLGDIIFFMSYRGSKTSDYKGINKRTTRKSQREFELTTLKVHNGRSVSSSVEVS